MQIEGTAVARTSHNTHCRITTAAGCWLFGLPPRQGQLQAQMLQKNAPWLTLQHRGPSSCSMASVNTHELVGITAPLRTSSIARGTDPGVCLSGGEHPN